MYTRHWVESSVELPSECSHFSLFYHLCFENKLFELDHLDSVHFFLIMKPRNLHVKGHSEVSRLESLGGMKDVFRFLTNTGILKSREE